MNVQITGISGFVGRNLSVYLQQKGVNIFPITRQQLENAEDWNFVFADAIVHLAGKAHDLRKTSGAEEYYNVNYEITKKLYDAFLKSELKIFIFISSVKAVADVVNGALTEEVLPNPQTHYGKSKLMAEQYIQTQPLPEGKSFYILRPCMIHGPGNKGNLNLLYQFVKRGIPYPLAAFDNKRSFLSVENLCFVIREIINRSDIPSGIFQVADDEALSTNEIVNLIAKETKHSIRLWSLSPRLIKVLAKLGDTIKLPLTTERLSKLTENYIVSNQKLKNALHKDFPVAATEGIITTIRSFRS